MAIVLVLSTSVAWSQPGRDSGPDTIDVFDYPKEIRESYVIFANKCSKCHSLARPINARINSARWWKRYVRKMMRKPGSGINAKSGKRIYGFLVYQMVQAKKRSAEL